MNLSSKSSESHNAMRELRALLLEPANDGRKIVILSRLILKKYIEAGFGLDDPQIEIILGIESETDTMIPSAQSSDGEFAHVYDIYAKPFDECRKLIMSSL